MKLKLKPSARIKRRYLLLEVLNKKEVEQIILEYIGVLGWAKADPKFLRHKKTGKTVLAIARQSLVDVRAAFEISKGKIKILRVSGTLKGLGK